MKRLFFHFRFPKGSGAPALLLFLAFSASAQVESASYNLMLKALLSHSVPEISVSDATRSPGSVFLDARSREEFEVSHIRNATYAGYEDFNLERIQKIDKSTPVIVYCSVGYRSEKIAEKLLAAGYRNVSNMYGGIFEWVNEGHAVYNMEGKPTRQVHAYDYTWGIWLHDCEKVY